MQKVMRKRILRDLRENLFRYLALGFLIILGMYVVISMVGAAETIIIGTADAARENRVEDGQFSLFAPLTEAETSSLEQEGITLEPHFYLDYSMEYDSMEYDSKEDDSVLRVFSQRKEIDLPQADFGKMPQESGEILLEKRYCEEHGICVDDEITVGGHSFRVCGIGTSPDYDTPLRDLSDSAVDSSLFGVGFLTTGDYDRLKEEKKSAHSEEYIYAYRLNGKLTGQELKEKLQDLDIEAENIDDSYFQEYWERTGGKLNDFREALDELKHGAEELKDGLGELDGNSSKMTKGASEIFDAYLAEASGRLSEYGVSELTGKNYKSVLEGLIASSDNAIMPLMTGLPWQRKSWAGGSWMSMRWPISAALSGNWSPACRFPGMSGK